MRSRRGGSAHRALGKEGLRVMLSSSEGEGSRRRGSSRGAGGLKLRPIENASGLGTPCTYCPYITTAPTSIGKPRVYLSLQTPTLKVAKAATLYA